MGWVAVLTAVLPVALNAQDVSVTDVEFLYGGGFSDWLYDLDAVGGRVTTLTIEHFSTWDYGDNFFFADLMTGSFKDMGGEVGSHSRIYAEWSSRLSLKALGLFGRGNGLIQDVFLASQVNQGGTGLRAYLAGLSADIGLPGFDAASASIYYRDDTYNAPQAQVTLVWSASFARSLTFEGFVDLAGTDVHGIDLSTQPSLLISLGDLLHRDAAAVQVGIEWYLHRARGLRISAPQAQLKWTW